MRPHAPRRIAAGSPPSPVPPPIYVYQHESARLSAVSALYAYNMLNVM